MEKVERVVPFPFHFLDNNQAMNIRPKNYSWAEFYDRLIDLCSYSFSGRAIYRRLRSNRELIPRWMNVVRAMSAEGFGRIRHHKEIRRRLDEDPEFLPFFNQESTVVPRFYRELVRKDLGDLWEWLPDGAIDHDPNAYRLSGATETPSAIPILPAAELAAGTA